MGIVCSHEISLLIFFENLIGKMLRNLSSAAVVGQEVLNFSIIRWTCADPGIFVRGVQVSLTKKALTTFF